MQRIASLPTTPTPAYEAARTALAALTLVERRSLLREMILPEELLDRGIEALAAAETSNLAVEPSLEDVRRALAPIEGSLADAVIAERGDY